MAANSIVLPKVQAILITGRSMKQGIGKETGKVSDRYRDAVALCEMHAGDMESLGIKSPTNVRATTKNGSVVLKATSSSAINAPGVVFVPYGPYANYLLNSETYGSGMPTFKGIPVEIEPALNEPVLPVLELMKRAFGR